MRVQSAAKVRDVDLLQIVLRNEPGNFGAKTQIRIAENAYNVAVPHSLRSLNHAAEQVTKGFMLLFDFGIYVCSGNRELMAHYLSHITGGKDRFFHRV